MTTSSLLVLGNDAVLAAAPATAVQLSHACLAAGYHAVVPVSWGDELIAERALAALSESQTPLIQCSCPLVARRVAANSDAIAPMTFTCVAPPVATALYLRALHGSSPLHITFVGGCVSGSHESIDVWLTADELLAHLAARAISPVEQPREFDSVLPPDRRRYYSEPGGLPSLQALRTHSLEVLELPGDDFAVDLAQALLSDRRALIDAAPALGCVCSGAVGSDRADVARARVRDVEPPRSPSPVVDHALLLPLQGLEAVASPGESAVLHEAPSMSEPLPPFPAPSSQPVAPPAPLLGLGMQAVVSPGVAPVSVEAGQRRTPPGQPRSVLGSMPQSRSTGKHLPRAYVARRRSSPKGMRQSGIRRQEELLRQQSDRSWPVRRWILIGAIVVLALGAFSVISWLL